MTLKPQLAADGESHRNAADRSAAAVTGDTFVINLCSSTTPMALVHPDAPELKRFRFFVSRRLEDGRERFRLHMGHFETLEEAEDWLSVVRDIYPGAWAGETPGKRLRAAAAAQAPAAATPPESKGAQFEESTANFAPQPQASLAPPPPATPDKFATPAAASPKQPSPAASLASHQEVIAAAPAATKPPAAQQPQPAPVVAPRRDAAAALRPARPAAKAPLSNVREVLAALDETDTSPNTTTSAAPRAATGAAQAPQSLSDTQVMQILEARRTEGPVRAAAADVSDGIPMLRPDDSGTRRALKEALHDNAAVSFAVQLQWSAEPMALDKVPPLAIFSAYALYTVEGNRDGRKWYGLRLGFFSDATAAKQVAQYVRSDFASVAVVPVSPQERGRASSADHKTPAVSFAEIQPATPPEEIKLLDDASMAAPRIPATPTGSAQTGSAAARAAATRSKALRSKERTAQRKGPYSLEETLEILGAGNLEIDNGRGELINESGVRHLKVEVRKNSPFQRLVARLTERVRKS
jgi:hypothetical protein